jgi:hypothetical protein
VRDHETAGAIPVASGAMSGQSYPSGPGWAGYRLPWPAAQDHITARMAGIGFDGEPGAGGATPPAGDAGTAGAGTATGSTPPATGDDGLGDAGKRALNEERTARRAAEAAARTAADELAKLKSEHQTDAEKALTDAKKAGAAEERAKLVSRVRQTEVRAALVGAGVPASFLDLAVNAPEFNAVKVTDTGDVEGLDEALKTFKAARADLLKPPATAGTADGGSRGGGKAITREQLKGMTPAQINEAFDKGELEALLKPPSRT